MPMQTLSLCTLHPPLVPLFNFTKTLKNPTFLRIHHNTTIRSPNSYKRITVFAVKGEEEQPTPSWAKPDSDEPPPWARNETQQTSSSSTVELPFFVYLLSSAITAIAAVGSVFEYVNQKPVFGVLNSDSIFYTPVLGFFAITGIPTAATLLTVSVASRLVQGGFVSLSYFHKRAQWLRAAILGANDGLLSTTSLMIGVGAAQEDQWFMILSGVAGAVAGACSMAVGEFVSVSTQRDVELAVIQEHPLNENSNLQEIKLETPKNDQTIVPVKSPVMNVVEKIKEDEKEALPNPFKAGAASALAFLCGSLFPLVAAMAVSDYTARIVVVVVVASVALALFGGIGAVVGGSNVRASATRVLFGGWISMVVSYTLLRPLDSITDKKMGTR